MTFLSPNVRLDELVLNNRNIKLYKPDLFIDHPAVYLFTTPHMTKLFQLLKRQILHTKNFFKHDIVLPNAQN